MSRHIDPKRRRLAIRLARFGCANRPVFQLFVTPTYKASQSKPLELLGSYDPMLNSNGEYICGMNFDRIKYYMGKGAHPTRPAAILLGLAGFLPLHPMTSILARRNLQRQQAEEAKKLKEETGLNDENTANNA